MKTIKYIYGVFAFLFALSISSCEDEFLEPDYERLVSLKKVQEYENLLNDQNLSIVQNSAGLVTPGVPEFQMSDNILPPDLNNVKDAFSADTYRAYIWSDQIFSESNTGVWTVLYNHIFTYNTILKEIDDAVDADVNQDKIIKIKAEALLGRAFEYLYLVNLFAQPYNSTDNTKTPGVPYMTLADITAKIPPRETLEDTYNKIEADLLLALPNLPELSEVNNTRGSKIAAYGVLARMHLYKQEFDKSLEYVNKALAIKSVYTDYTEPFFRVPFYLNENPDNLYVRTNPLGIFPRQFNISEDLYALFPKALKDHPFIPGLKEVTDLDVRFSLLTYFMSPGSTTPSIFLNWFDSNNGITVQELILTKAELLARKGELSEALSLINNFRRKRIKPEDYNAFLGDLSSDNKEEVLTWVLNERRKEFVPNSTRFLDMRRLQLEGRIGTVTHYIGNGETVSLEEGSPRYTLRIPQIVLDYNPDMEQNP